MSIKFCCNRKHRPKIGVIRVMMQTIEKMHTFDRAQRVKFAGGEGIVRSFKFEAQHWTYLVEMPLGQEPQFGRVGAETMVLLSETELRAA